MEGKPDIQQNMKIYSISKNKKVRNKYILSVSYDEISRKRANDIMKNIIKFRKREKEAYCSLPENVRQML